MADEEYEKELKHFYRGMRSKNANKAALFQYDADGNLVEYDKDGSIVKALALKNYRPPTSEEIAEAEAERRKGIAEAEADLEEKLKELKELITSGTATPDEIVRQNIDVEVADLTLQQIRFPERGITSVGANYPVNKILFEERYEKRMLKEINLPLYYSMTLQDIYVREGVAAAAVAAPAAGSAASAKKLRARVVLFGPGADDKYKELTAEWPVEIEIGDNIYKNAYAAMMGQMAIFYNKEDVLEEILEADVPEAIDFDYEKAGATEEGWNGQYAAVMEDVMRAKFKQHPALLETLLSTGKAKLGAIIPGDTVFGIGLAADDPLAKQYPWPGQNKLGLVLELIRREERMARTAAEEEAVAVAAAAAPAPAPATQAQAPKADNLMNIFGETGFQLAQEASAQPQAQPQAIKIKRKK
jgi:ribA/ribD-fused uncharacterized protein